MAAPFFQAQELATLEALYQSGLTSIQLAEHYHCDPSTIQSWLKKLGCIRDASQCKKIYQAKEDVFETIDTEEKAYWLGFLYADGCVMNVGRRGRVILYLSEKDISRLKAFSHCLESTYPIRTDAKRKACGISLASDKMRDDLIRWGCIPRKSLHLSFPALPFHLCPHFIRGYYDGDGSAFVSKCGKTPNISLLGNIEFLETVELYVFYGTNVNGSFHKHSSPRSDVYYLIYRGEFKTTSVGKWLYKDAHVWIDRKRERVDHFLAGKRSGYHLGVYEYI
jgi:hypothetical protein